MIMWTLSRPWLLKGWCNYHHLAIRSSSSVYYECYYNNRGGCVVVDNNNNNNNNSNNVLVVHTRRWYHNMIILQQRYSRMLDMGGAPSSMNDKSSTTTHLNLNKNCHLQVVIFDFDLLTRSVEKDKGTTSSSSKVDTSTTSTSSLGSINEPLISSKTVKPDIEKVQNVADLLKVDITGKSKTNNNDKNDSFEKDDLSLILGSINDDKESKGTMNEQSLTKTESKASIKKKKSVSSGVGGTNDDIRAKYAAKLKNVGLSGGLSTVDRIKDEDNTNKGDASTHFTARAHATTESRWMAATGTGKLLNYLYQRSMKLILIPVPVRDEDTEEEANLNESKQMDDFCAQMKIQFHTVLKQDGTYTVEKIIRTIQDKVLQQQSSNNKDNNNNDKVVPSIQNNNIITPDRCVWVSDRDDCLRIAKDVGMVTVRVRPPNARRGNVSTHYTIPNIHDFTNVVDEMNGISFNTVLQQR